MDNVSFTTVSSGSTVATGGHPFAMMPPGRNFDSIKYVNDLTSKPSVTLESLTHARKTVANCADETNTLLKRNVYKNYQLFIDTSKEISYLKKEMSQLAKVLNDETKLLDSLLSISVGGSKVGLTPSEKKEALDKVKEERERKMLQMSKSNLNGPLPTKEFRAIMETIEGGAGIIDNKQDSLVYFEGEVIELDDTQDYRELQAMYLVLLNDSLIMNTVIPDRSGGALPKITFGIAGGPASGGRKYKFQSIIDLETIAVVNVKDRRYTKFEMAFKVLMSATTKVFLTNSTAKKKAWVEAFEIAKKYRRTASRLQRRDTMMLPSMSSSTISANASGHGSTADQLFPTTPGESSKSPVSAYTSNPFEETEPEEDGEADPETPYWLLELPDDLDVYIAQRNFEDAVKLVANAHNHFYMYPKSQVDLKLRIDNKINELVDALTSELNVAPDRSLQTGPRASRRAVSLLVRLGKSSLAIRLFLDQRSKLLKHYRKQLKPNDTLHYMKRMTNLFFSHIVETSKEFLRAFEIDANDLGVGALRNMELDSSLETGNGGAGGGNKWSRRNSDDGTIDEPSSGHSASTPTLSFSHSVLACLNTWNYQQLKEYLELFPKHVFIGTVPKEIKVKCIAEASQHCTQLRHAIGVDFTFVLSRELKKPIDGLISELRDQMTDAIKLRSESSAASLTEQVFDSKAKLVKFRQEMATLDLNIDEWVHESVDERHEPPQVVYGVELTANTVSFIKSYLNTLTDLLKLATHPTTIKQINDVLIVGFKLQMAHLARCAKPRVNGQTGNPELVRRNIIFMLERLIPVVIGKYCEALNLRSFNDLQVLSIDYAYLKEASGAKVTTSFSTASSTSSPKTGSPFGSPVPAPRARKTTQIQVNSSSSSSNGTPGSPGGGGGAGNGTSNGNWTSGTYL